MEWLLFGIGVAVIGLIGIGLGLFAGRAWARRAERRSDDGDEEFMTPVGPAPDATDAANETGGAVDAAAGANGAGDRGA